MSSPIAGVVSLFKKIINSVFGSASWTPPGWIKWSSAKIFGAILLTAIAYLRFLEQKPKRFFLANILALATIVGSVLGYRWYINLPKPSTLTLYIKEIPATDLEVESPKPNPFYVDFSGSAATLDKVGKDIIDGIDVKPKVAGTWRWTSDSRLEFNPLQDWEVGQTYAVTLKKSLFPRHILLEKYSFEFSSPKFISTVKSGEFYEDPTTPKNKQGVVTLSFTHPVDKSDLERKVSVRMRIEPVKSFDDSAVKKLGFKISYNDKATEAYIRSDLINIPDKDGEMLVSIGKDLHSARAGKGTEAALTRTIHVPGVENYFKISDIHQNVITNEQTYAAERIITISSTAGVSQSELAKNVEVLLIPNDPEIYDQGIEDTSSDEVQEEESEEGGDESYEESGESEYNNSESSYTPDLPEDSCPWSKAAQVPDIALKKAQILNVKWIPTEKEFSTENSFKFNADIGRCVFVRIKKGTKSFGDYPLVDARNFVQIAQPFSQDLKITDKGSLLALSGEKKIGLMARGLKSVKFTLFRVLPNSLHHLSTQGFQYDAAYSQPNFNYNFGPENISEVFESIVTLPAENPGKPQYTVFDFGRYLEEHPNAERGLFFLKASGYDPETKSNAGPKTERLVLVSNLGFILKDQQDNTHQLYVMSTALQSPVAAATVEVLGKNGQPIFTAVSDDIGKVDLPNLKDFHFEKEPSVYVVKKDGDLSFMPYNRSDRKLNLSRFDVGGLYTEKASESLQAYLFSDRGIYRPGETAHLGLIIKSLNWKSLPNNIPFELTILDPRGIEIKKQKINFPADGFAEYDYPVSESALTGNYSVQISLVRPKKSSFLLGTTSIRVEEFLPDRLKISSTLSKPLVKGWLTPEDLKVQVGLRNLYGTPAEGNTIKSKLRLSPYYTRFDGWSDFSFFDPFAAKNSFNEDLGEVLTDSNGEANIDLGLERFEKATYQLSVFTQGLEKEGGRAVTTNVSALVSPQSYLIGWKPGGDLSFIKKDFVQKVKVVAVGQDLQSIDVDNLTLERVEVRYVSVLAKQASGSLAYQSIKKNIIKDTRSFSITKEGSEITLPSDEPGSFYYELRDAHGLVLNTIPYTIVGNANLNGSMERNSELQIKLNKRDFAPEEEIEFEVQAPYIGTGLITIERDKVYAASWFKTDTNSSVQRIKVPKGLEGNGYINVAFVRSLDSKEIFTSPLSYGIEPFSVSKDLRTEKINLNVPNQILPGQTLSIEASVKNPTKAVVYAIDEGILQVARYKTPDPLSYFFRKRALEVETEQIVDLLLPEYRWVREFSAAGGDEDALLGKHRNPFKRKGQKPVIFWSGLVNLGPDAQKFSFDVPDYFNGSIKVFAVSVSDNTVGVAEKQTTVQGDIVLSPNAPLFAAPGDEFTVSVVVANTKLPDGNFDISLQNDSRLKILSESKQSLNIATTKDAVASFQVKALESLGSSDLIFRASGQGAKAEARYTIDLSVRPAAARLDTLKTGILKSSLLGAKEIVVPLERSLFKEESQRNISFSTLPVSLVRGLAQYLEYYPHGCTEQITSQAFPALILSKDPAFNLNPDQVQRAMNRAYALQGARQRDDGSFSFWPGYNEQSDWLSLHVGRFLLEAKERGFSPPKSLIENSTVFIRQIAVSSSGEITLTSARNRAYAIYLLTRAGEVTTNYLQTLREELEASEIKGWKEDIVSLLMASSYKLLQLDKDAEEFSKKVSINFTEDTLNRVPFFATGSKIGLYLDLSSRHFPEKAKALDGAFFEKIATLLADNSYSTIVSANLMLGLDQFQKLVGDSSVPEAADILGSLDGVNFAPLTIPAGRIPTLSLNHNLTSIKLIGKSDQNVFYQISQSGFDKPGTSKESAHGLEINREYRNDKGEVITEANLGDDITVVIGLRSKDGFDYIDNVAVTDLLPTGLEIAGGTQGLSGNVSKLSDPWTPQFVDAREDRALLYGTVSSSIGQYSYKAKAVSKGTFVIPPIQAEAMYDPRVIAVVGSGSFTVK